MRNEILAGMVLAATALTWAGNATAQEIRLMCSANENECLVLGDIAARFEAENPGVDVVIDEVSYQAILETLPVQLAAGEGPDLATVTDLGGLNRYYLDISPYVERDYWEENFAGTIDWFRAGAEDEGIYGLVVRLTITGAFINRDLFDQAGVEVPGRDATWEDWAEAARAVAEATGTDYPMALDRSGHRLAAPAMTYGAQIFDADGAPILVDEGFTDWVEQFVAWNNDGTMARDIWASVGGTSYRDASEEFINGQVVYYYSGSWQTSRFNELIGDLFQWQVVGTPCGVASCTGMPGATGVVGFSGTENPEVVAAFLDFLAQDDNYREFAIRTLNVPAHTGVAAAGLEFTDVSPAIAAGLNAWTEEVARISPVAFAYQGHPSNRAMFNITVQRVSQAILGELTVEEAMERARADLAEALANEN